MIINHFLLLSIFISMKENVCKMFSTCVPVPTMEVDTKIPNKQNLWKKQSKDFLLEEESPSGTKLVGGVLHKMPRILSFKLCQV